jgi:HK97 gp10 family phage protein
MSGIDLSGFGELETLLQGMTLTEAEEKKAVKKSIDVIAKVVESNTPVGKTGSTRKEIKTKVGKDDFSVTGKVIMGAWYTGFEEFGTSQNKKNIGFFERAVNSSQNEALEILSKELLK